MHEDSTGEVGEIRIPAWVFYGLLYGGLIPGMTSLLPFWSIFPGMAIGLIVGYKVDRHLASHR